MYIGKLLCFRTLPLYNSKLFDLIKVANVKMNDNNLAVMLSFPSLKCPSPSLLPPPQSKENITLPVAAEKNVVDKY